MLYRNKKIDHTSTFLTFFHTLVENFFQYSKLIWHTFNRGRLPKLSLLIRTLYASQCVPLVGWTLTKPTIFLKTESLKHMSKRTPSLLTISLVRMFSFNAYFFKRVKKQNRFSPFKNIFHVPLKPSCSSIVSSAIFLTDKIFF